MLASSAWLLKGKGPSWLPQGLGTPTSRCLDPDLKLKQHLASLKTLVGLLRHAFRTKSLRGTAWDERYEEGARSINRQGQPGIKDKREEPFLTVSAPAPSASAGNRYLLYPEL